MFKNKINVVVPFHNVSKQRCDVLALAIAQCSYQIVIILDHPTIDELEIYKIFENNNNVVTLINKSNVRGPGATRDLGLEFTKESWVIFLDCDDLIDWVKLANVLKNRFLKKETCYCFWMTEIFDEQIERNFPISVVSEKNIAATKLNIFDFFLGGVAYNKILFYNEGCLHNTKYLQGEDLLFRINLFKKYDKTFEFLCDSILYTSVRRGISHTTDIGSTDEIKNWLAATALLTNLERIFFSLISVARYHPVVYKLLAKPYRLLRKYNV